MEIFFASQLFFMLIFYSDGEGSQNQKPLKTDWKMPETRIKTETNIIENWNHNRYKNIYKPKTNICLISQHWWESQFFDQDPGYFRAK